MKNNNKSGFSAVELLVTLFIAALFLVAGYQLYSLIIQDGGKTKAQARANNVVYDYLKRYENFAVNPCDPETPVNNEPIVVDGLDDVSMTVAITCPYTANTTISKITATISYNSGEILTESNYVYAK